MTQIVALVGPTAVGKSAIAVEVARLLGAEIISCDSMQIYRGMRVLSQAPTHAQQAQVPHHLVEFVEPTESFSVADYCGKAAPTIERILARGKGPLLVGGTGLYLKALAQGLCHAPPADPRIREQLWHECQGRGSATLHYRLRGIDATAASRIHPNDARRIVRALEVYALTGKPLSTWWAQTNAQPWSQPMVMIGLTRERAELYERINQRVVHMIYEEAVINEVRALLRVPLSQSARHIHGLADLESYLAGERSLKETITVWQQRVRHYARRQLTWFRQTPGIQWLQLAAHEPPWESAERVRDVLRRSRQPLLAV